MIRLLLIHNTYQQRGGEDVVFETERDLMRDYGNTVDTYLVNNHDVSTINRIQLAADTVWSLRSKRALRDRLQKLQPDVAHFHNTLPLISPSGYAACRAEGVPVVQTLHNYRLLCPNTVFFRDGHVCEDCLNKSLPWPGVVHACYRGSRPATGVVAAMLTTHRVLGTWTKMVDVYIALTEFARQKFIEGGIPAKKIIVKPNFVYPDPGVGKGRGGYALFVGRLSPEKGLDVLLAGWERLEAKFRLKIIGDGPLAGKVVEASRRSPEVEWLGSLPANEVLALMGEASVLVFPSEWYETFGRVAVEAFAKGTPVISSNLGAVPELIRHGVTGLHFCSGDPESLATQVEWAFAHPAELAWMRREARAEFEAKYTAERNYQMLMEAYELAINRARGADG